MAHFRDEADYSERGETPQPSYALYIQPQHGGASTAPLVQQHQGVAAAAPPPARRWAIHKPHVESVPDAEEVHDALSFFTDLLSDDAVLVEGQAALSVVHGEARAITADEAKLIEVAVAASKIKAAPEPEAEQGSGPGADAAIEQAVAQEVEAPSSPANEIEGAVDTDEAPLVIEAPAAKSVALDPWPEDHFDEAPQSVSQPILTVDLLADMNRWPLTAALAIEHLHAAAMLVIDTEDGVEPPPLAMESIRQRLWLTDKVIDSYLKDPALGATATSFVSNARDNIYRLALADRQFLVNPAHPGRALLDRIAIAETVPHLLDGGMSHTAIAAAFMKLADRPPEPSVIEPIPEWTHQIIVEIAAAAALNRHNAAAALHRHQAGALLPHAAPKRARLRERCCIPALAKSIQANGSAPHKPRALRAFLESVLAVDSDPGVDEVKTRVELQKALIDAGLSSSDRGLVSRWWAKAKAAPSPKPINQQQLVEQFVRPCRWFVTGPRELACATASSSSAKTVELTYVFQRSTREAFPYSTIAEMIANGRIAPVDMCDADYDARDNYAGG